MADVLNFKRFFSSPEWKAYEHELDVLIDRHREKADEALMQIDPTPAKAIGGVIEGLKTAARKVPKRLLIAEKNAHERGAEEHNSAITEDATDLY